MKKKKAESHRNNSLRLFNHLISLSLSLSLFFYRFQNQIKFEDKQIFEILEVGKMLRARKKNEKKEGKPRTNSERKNNERQRER